VSAANERLVLDTGVAGAIRQAGGPRIQEECHRHGPIRVGEAALTGAGDLRVRWVIHAAAMGDEPVSARSIRESTLASLTLAARAGARRIAFPVLEDASLNGISDAVRDLATEPVRDARRRTQAPDVDGLGAGLFDALFSGGVRELFLESLSGVRAQQEVLRVCLQIDIADPALARLASLPWEYMQNRERNEPLVLSSSTTLIRRLPTSGRVEPRTFAPPLRVLFVMADARGNLDLTAERAEIESALARAESPIECVFRERMTWIEFDEDLHRGDYHVVHFMGHGAFEGDTGLLEFQDQSVPGREVGVRLLKEPATRLIVLNACRTAEVPRVAGGDVFASVAASLALAGVPAVIAMQFPVSDRAAIAFATRLYTGIAQQRSIEEAVDDARAGMRAVSRQEWGTPVVILRDSGDLFSAPAPPAPGERSTIGPARCVPWARTWSQPAASNQSSCSVWLGRMSMWYSAPPHHSGVQRTRSAPPARARRRLSTTLARRSQATPGVSAPASTEPDTAFHATNATLTPATSR